MGDPQAPFATVLEILDAHRLLGPRGTLRDEVQLVSMGDHFDWGDPSQRKQATDDATALLSWLASHPREQVVLLAGNHDLARVCELWPFHDDATFEAAHAEAAQLYRGTPGPDALAAFSAKYPHLPDPECLARDFSAYASQQQREVIELLRTKRFRLAHAHRGLLLVHAGVTSDDFALLGEVPLDAEAAAERLNAFFDARLDAWDQRGPFELTPLHQPGTVRGEARGILFHRPGKPEASDARFEGPPRRRFDPRRLPPAFPQAIGHVRDKKAREELRDWADGAAPRDGVLRALTVEGERVHYAVGTPKGARLYFLDAGMLHLPRGQRYELFDLDRREPA